MGSAAERLLLVGSADPVHVGAHFAAAATTLGLPVHLHDTAAAHEGPAWRRKADWWIRGHRPANLGPFSRDVLRLATDQSPTLLLSTGLAPIDRESLTRIGRLGILRVNFLTDDPWNPAHRAPWFLGALPHYDVVFSPRRANLDELRSLGVRAVEYLPFAFNPDVHFPDPPQASVDRERFDADVLLAGGADAERARLVGVLHRGGLKVGLYGHYWNRYPETRNLGRDTLNAADLRMATSGARIALTLVRRANRDGNAMRTYEVPAMMGCPLIESTADHRMLFGTGPDDAVYFHDAGDVLAAARSLLDDEARRVALAARAHARVTQGRETYRDRLETILAFVAEGTRENRPRDARTLSRI